MIRFRLGHIASLVLAAGAVAAVLAPAAGARLYVANVGTLTANSDWTRTVSPTNADATAAGWLGVDGSGHPRVLIPGQTGVAPTFSLARFELVVPDGLSIRQTGTVDSVLETSGVTATIAGNCCFNADPDVGPYVYSFTVMGTSNVNATARTNTFGTGPGAFTTFAQGIEARAAGQTIVRLDVTPNVSWTDWSGAHPSGTFTITSLKLVVDDPDPPVVAVTDLAATYGASTGACIEVDSLVTDSGSRMANWEVRNDTGTIDGEGGAPSTFTELRSATPTYLVNDQCATTTEGTHTWTVHGEDRAGNVVNDVQTYVVDRTAPVVTVGAPDGASIPAGGSIGVDANDALTGLATVTATLDSAPVMISNAAVVVPNGATAGTHVLVVRATDLAGNEASRTVTFTVPAPTTPKPTTPQRVVFTGGSGPDVRSGSTLNDVLVGLGGNDRLSGLAGNDILRGGPGNDVLVGGPGRDVLDGAGGNDTLRARDGERDTVACGPGRRDVAIVDALDRVTGCEIIRRP